MRGVNVGGHKTFRPNVLAKELAGLGVINIGAAGTFVVRAKISQASLRAEFQKALPFEPELIFCPAREVIALAESDPFRRAPAESKDLRHYVTVMPKPLRLRPCLPLEQPGGTKWEVKIIGITGRFVLSLWRRTGKGIVYPNTVVEKQFAVPATTRNWNTISAICDVLEN
jgi:uncharacterized protein (DUF1697 family)